MNTPTLPKFTIMVTTAKDNAAFVCENYNDTLGYDFVRYLVQFGNVPADMAVDVKVTECETSGGSYTDITSAATIAVTAAAGDDKIHVIDVKLGGDRMRYQKVAATAGNGATVVTELAIIAENHKAETRANTYADAGLTGATYWVQV